MIVLLGGTGYIGGQFARTFAGARHPVCRALARGSGLRPVRPSCASFCEKTRPEFLINAAGYTGKPNVDACEKHWADTLQGNTLFPAAVAHACASSGHSLRPRFLRLHLQLAPKSWRAADSRREGFDQARICRRCWQKNPGAIHGFTEDGRAEFHFSPAPVQFLQRDQGAGARKPLRGVGQGYIWRLRIPFDQFDNPRNYLSKVRNYPKVYDNVNSLSHRGDFVAACLDLWQRRAPFGIYNVTNPGFVTSRQVVAMIQKILQAGAARFEFWADDEEFYRVAAKTPRSNCVLDVTKLLAAGVEHAPGRGGAGGFTGKLELNLNNELLVTGGAGFIGSNLIHHIIDQPEIQRLVNVDCLTYAGHLENLEGLARHPKYVFEKTDLRDKDAILRRGATARHHPCAAFGGGIPCGPLHHRAG